MTTQEGNKLIAEFMGGRYKTVYSGLSDATEERFYMPDSVISEPILDFKDQLPYHKNWDWLMPVVEGIEDLDDSDGFKPFAVNLESMECEIIDYKNQELSIAYCEGESKMEAAYNAVIEFIQWYNDQTQTT